MHLTALNPNNEPIEDYDLDDPKEIEDLAAFLTLICGTGLTDHSGIYWETSEHGQPIQSLETRRETPPEYHPHITELAARLRRHDTDTRYRQNPEAH